MADFEDDPEIYVFKGLKYIGMELWQVNAFVPFILVPFFKKTFGKRPCDRSNPAHYLITYW